MIVVKLAFNCKYQLKRYLWEIWSLTGIGIFDNSFPIQFFIMLHRLILMSGLSGICLLNCFVTILPVDCWVKTNTIKKPHQAMKMFLCGLMTPSTSGFAFISSFKMPGNFLNSHQGQHGLRFTFILTQHFIRHYLYFTIYRVVLYGKSALKFKENREYGILCWWQLHQILS